MSEKAGLAGIWEDIRNCLQVTTEVLENPQGDNTLKIRFVVTNTAKNDYEQPDIVFDQVVLKVGIPDNWHCEHKENLGSGDSFDYVHHCSHGELSQLQYTIEGRLSPSSLLNVKLFSRKITAQRQTLTIKSYLDFLEQANLYKWIEILKNLKIPEPETTIAEIEAQKSNLNQNSGEIQKTRDQLQQVLGFVKKNERVLQHKQILEEYLNKTQEAYSRLSSLYSTPSRGREIVLERDRLLSKLSTRIENLEKVKEELIKEV
jgi:hypothetical protein